MANEIEKRTRVSRFKKSQLQRSDPRRSKIERKHINIVLVGSLYDWNVGSVSRVITNMGVNRLIMVRPKCEFSFKAQQAAATGQRPYQNRTVYQNWDEFNKNELPGVRIAFTALDGDKRRTKNWNSILSNKKIKSKIVDTVVKEKQSIYLIFGPEDHGLQADEMDLTHFNVCLPVSQENESLNLSHAVLLALYMLIDCWNLSDSRKTLVEPKKESEVFFPDQLIKDWLNEMGYQVDNRRRSIFTVLKRTVLESVATRRDLKMLESLFQQALRKTREYNKLRIKN